jgi:hypothetical protein
MVTMMMIIHVTESPVTTVWHVVKLHMTDT